MSKQLHRLKDENGQSLILVVLALPMLLALTLLVVDGANLFVQRRAIQNAADASALAVANRQLDPYGGGCLPSDPVDPQSGCKTTLVNYSNRNAGPRAPNLTNSNTCGGITNTDTNCYTIETPYKGSATRVKVTLIKSVSTFFGGVASLFGGGVSNFNVSASAVTGLSNATAAGNVVPMTVQNTKAPSLPCSNDPACCPITPGCIPFNQDVTFNFNDSGTGGYALIDLDTRSTTGPTLTGSSGASTMASWIRDGYKDSNGVKQQLPSNAWYGDRNGQANGIKQGLLDAQDAGTVLLVPVFDKFCPTATSPTPPECPTPGSPIVSYHVIGFAAFQICGDQSHPTPNMLVCPLVPNGMTNWSNDPHQLTGRFVTFIASGVGCSDPATCGQSFGVFVVTVFE